MMRTLACCVVLLPGVFGRAVVGAETKPNFILIVADNLEYGDLGCFGSKARSHASSGPHGR